MINRNEAPAIHALGQPELLKPTILSAEGQIPLYSFYGPGSNVVRIEWTLSGGNFVKEKTPQADFTVNLMSEGTKSFSAKQIADTIDFYGASFHGENSFSEVIFTLHCTKDSLKEILPVVSEIFTAPTFPENEFNIHKNRSIERLKVKWKKVSYVASVHLSKLMHPNHIIGQVTREENLQALTRQDVVDYYENHIRGKFMHCIAAGDVDEDMQKTLMDFNRQLGKSADHTGRDYTLADLSKDEISKTNIDGAIQSCIAMAYKAVPRRHQDFVPLQLLNTILGGYFGSRLMSNLREEKGYTYGIGSGINVSYGFGYISISTEVGAEVTADALKEIYFETKKLCTESIGEQELELAKNYLIGSFIRNSDGVFAMADRYRPLLNSDLDYSYYDHYFNAVKNATAEQLMGLAKKYLDQPHYLSVAGKTSH